MHATTRAARGVVFSLLLLLAAHPCRAQWKAAQGPLRTRWAQDLRPETAHQEYPRMQMVRERWLNLNGLWHYAEQDPTDDKPGATRQDGEILVPFPIESALSGVMKRAERFWYWRSFEIPSAWAGQRVLLHFGAVDWECKVFVNEQSFETHQGGYDPFTFDITDALTPRGEQRLIVGVFDPSSSGTQPRGKQVDNPEGIYYTPSTGIWQTVWLEPVPQASIESLKLTPDCDASCLRLVVQGRGSRPGQAVRAVARDGEREVATITGKVGEELQLAIPGPKLWTPDDPFLYALEVSLPAEEAQAAPIDRVESYFAMRKIEVAQDEAGVPRILLNGQFVFQIGTLDQGFWPDGLYTAPCDEALRFDIEQTKRLGFNMIRKHVKVEPDRWYYWCDKLGMLVWQDMPSGEQSVPPGGGEITRSAESARQFELELERLLACRHNHPCIIVWVVFNEGWGQYDTVRITNAVKKMDPSRLTNAASGWNDMPVGDLIDMHSYPGPNAPNSADGRAAVLGEFGGLGLGIDGHTWTDKTWGYRGASDQQNLSRQYVSLLRAAWALKDSAGLNAAIYTQITDVETEANGLLTYDREIVKVDVDRIRAANQGVFPILETLLATSEKEPALWRYTFQSPAKGWTAADFDDAKWKQGPAGFGTPETPGTMVRTRWSSSDIWLRREFTLPDRELGEILLSLHHDEDVEIYINGVLACQATGYSTHYEEQSLTNEGRAAIQPGKNTFAVHCHQTRGGQYIDLGLLEVTSP